MPSRTRCALIGRIKPRLIAVCAHWTRILSRIFRTHRTVVTRRALLRHSQTIRRFRAVVTHWTRHALVLTSFVLIFTIAANTGSVGSRGTTMTHRTQQRWIAFRIRSTCRTKVSFQAMQCRQNSAVVGTVVPLLTRLTVANGHQTQGRGIRAWRTHRRCY